MVVARAGHASGGRVQRRAAGRAVDTSADHLRALLPNGTLVHVVRPFGQREGLERDDGALLAPFEEIVDVAVEVAPENAAVHDCLVEAVWDTTLGISDAPPHATTRVAFGNKR